MQVGRVGIQAQADAPLGMLAARVLPRLAQRGIGEEPVEQALTLAGGQFRAEQPALVLYIVVEREFDGVAVGLTFANA